MKKSFKLFFAIFLIFLFNPNPILFAKNKIQPETDLKIVLPVNNQKVNFCFSNNFFEWYDNTDYLKINLKVSADLGDALRIKYKAQINSDFFNWTLYIKKDMTDLYVEDGLSSLTEFVQAFSNLCSKNPNIETSIIQLSDLFNIENPFPSQFNSKTKKIETWERLLCTVGTVGAYVVSGPIGAILYNGICLSLADIS